MNPSRTLATIAIACSTSLGAFGQDEIHQLVSPKVYKNSYYGAAVAVANDLVLVGNHASGFKNRGRAEVYDLQTGLHRRTLKLEEPIDNSMFGFPITMTEKWTLIGSRYGSGSSYSHGAVHVMDPRTGVELAKLTAPDGESGQSFGRSIAICGDMALIGAPGDDTAGPGAGAAYLVDIPSGNVIHKWIGSDTSAGDDFGLRLDLSERYAVVGGHKNLEWIGAAYVFDVATGQEVRKLVGAGTYRDCLFGWPISIAGGKVLIGAIGEKDQGLEYSGAAYLFDLETGAQLRRLSSPYPAAKSSFGQGLVLTEEVAIVGQPGDLNEYDELGRVFVFDVRTGELLETLTPSDNGIGDLFGWPIARDGCTLVIGSLLHDDPDGGWGAAYVFPVPLTSERVTCEGNPNSTGAPGRLSAEGTRCLLANRLTLHASAMPQHQAGFFLVSTDGDYRPFFGGGAGDLCLATPLGRFSDTPFDSGSGGASQIDVDLTALPGGHAVHPGETLHFQAWYRDGPTSNLTNGLAVDFE